MPINQSYDGRLVLALSCAQLISWGSIFYMFSVFMAPLEQAMDWSRSQVSLGFSLALLAEGLMAYPVGRLIDAGWERLVMAGGSLLAATGLLVLSQVQTMAGFYGAWVVLGAAMAAVLYAPAFAVVTRRFRHDYRRAIIAMTFLGGLASTVFIPLMVWMIDGLGWRQTLGLLAALHGLVLAPLHAYVLRHAPGPGAGEPRLGTAASVPQASALKPLLGSRVFGLIALFLLIMMSITVAIPAHLLPLLGERSLSAFWVVALPATIGLTQVLGRVLLYVFESRLNVDRVNRTVPLLIPAALLVLLLAPLLGPLPAVAGFVLLYGIGNGLLTIVRGTVVAQYVSSQHVGALNGALGVPLALARASAPLLLGLAWSEAWGYTWANVAMLLLAVLAVLALRAAQRIASPPANSPAAGATSP